MTQKNDSSRVTAVLGPTNTGKTHMAMERMLAHTGGIIGFPLRLLARENYDRAVRVKGADQVALITGEEKIVPRNPRYYLCTVEAMPLSLGVPFLGVDEIQLCADAERGHVFTDRLLHARGHQETMFMGADTIKPLLRQLVPGVDFIDRPRLSTLRHAGACKITRLPPRAVVVAFSANDVYAIAELVRRRRGGAAVVLGALSPRTRNAQVALYQAGEVDHLVATDAIGMGLNMDVDHVAFARRRKFDGRRERPLSAGELGQIAGRAGRHLNDGTFGVTGQARPFESDLVARLESHRFDRLTSLYWRNSDLRFSSLDALRASLAVKSTTPGLILARQAADEAALETLSLEKDIGARATSPDTIRLLWDVCCIPDFEKTEGHFRLLRRVFDHLSGTAARLPTDWFADQIARIDRTDGEIDHLVHRIARIRTWTFISHRSDWLDDSASWQQKTRAIEDRLSDALHVRLTNRFVDKRTSILARKLRDEETLAAVVEDDGAVRVEGHYLGRLKGLRFTADSAGDSLEARTLSGAAMRALRGEVATRIARLGGEDPGPIEATPVGRLMWAGGPVARLVAGPSILEPAVEVLKSDLMSAQAEERVGAALRVWLSGFVARRLGPLTRLSDLDLNGAARGLAFQIGEALGCLPRRGLAQQINALSKSERRMLRDAGVKFGRESLFVPELQGPKSIAARALLYGIFHGAYPPVPEAGRPSVERDPQADDAFYLACGYRPLGRHAVRVDVLERLSDRAWKRSQKQPFAATPDLLSLVGCEAEVLGGILGRLGYAKQTGETAPVFARRKRRPAASKNKKKTPRLDPDSPFFVLNKMKS